MMKNILIAGFMSVLSFGAFAQCTDWVSPTDSTGWTDFGTIPCTGESFEIVAFEVYKSEAYSMEGVIVDGNYTFSMCNGPNAGAWIPEFTIIAPSGAVDAYGAGDGDGCSITWTATEAGTYLIVINEAENCGVEEAANNGYPMITTNLGIDCEGGEDSELVLIDGAESFEDSESLPECWTSIDADNDGFDWNVIVSEEIAFDGMHSIRSESYSNDSGVLNPDNYLITPMLNITDGDSLYYGVRALDIDYAADQYSVLVSTTGTEVADFTDIIFNETLDSDVWAPRSFDLSAYAGQSIYIAFRHHDVSDMFAFVMDAIHLPGVDCNPDAIVEIKGESTNLYPNPANDQINLISAVKGNVQVTIIDAVGRTISSEIVTFSDAPHRMDVSNLNAGMYTVTLQSEGQIVTQNFSKQ